MLGSTRGINSCDLVRIMVLICNMHFTIQKQIGVAKRLNHTLLEKVWYLLSNAQLDKSFWAEVLEYASYLMNILSSTVI